MEAQKPEWITQDEYAKVAEVSVSTIKRWAKKGYGPQPHRWGPRRVRYDKAEVLEYLRTGEKCAS
ncbi:putative DNA-binding transcriptional regulator AlpA [Lipingzhangella halophila]|uniref:Putative DNA-binding transcriptional regulator AlpA n=1 Tax=Lipingzhangella halophila TaxID=1783352 RepID=A0A7W7RGW0_9ACTN|nr:helix-turn-helix domain-containing protein [Lipingzhangella halophila]MBB4931418.1 putative DNA-binding transcriptional regulator AlpA [Lipingzhangella halophila]